MGAIALIDYEKRQIAPINFHCKQGLNNNFHPSIKIPNNWYGILHSSFEIANNALVR